ncbi:MAG: hypothetical protein RIA08_05585 [Roseovarius sp.]
MKNTNNTVLGHHAPAPRPTLFGLTLFAAGLSLGFLLALGLVRLFFN